ncbi:MAG TPA: carboxypeptidase-like regulatory domain-containing protein [Methanomassiliicoccales archaeon]|jgi:hypothetical protein
MKRIATLLLTVALLISAIPVLTAPALSATVEQGFQGTVLNETGAPMSEVVITARNTTTDSALTTFTNSAGAFALNTPNGTYNISAGLSNYRSNITYVDKTIISGQAVELNFTMTEILGSLNGFVTDGKAPVNGVTVVMASDHYNYTAVTVAPLGEYRISKIQPDTYVANFTKLGYDRTNSLPLVIKRGVIKLYNASMQAQPCTLFGQVTENGNPQDGVTITARGQDTLWTGTTDAKGNYSIQLTADSYTVTFTKKDFNAKDVSISLAPFEDRQLDVSILKSKNNNTSAYLFGFDLPHSLMVIGLIIALATICAALFVNFKVRKKPELLGQDPHDEKRQERS